MHASAMLFSVVVIALAWCYYLERTVCFDSAFYSWLLIDTGEPVSFHGRIGSWPPQLLPLALIDMGAPLSTVLRAYSVCLALVPVLLLLLIAWPLRDVQGAIALPLTLLTGTGLSFYYGVSEVNQGIAFCVLVDVLLRHQSTSLRGTWLNATFTIAAAVWATLYHQVMLIPLAFIVGRLVLRSASKARWHVIAACVVFALWAFVRLKLFESTAYERERMPGPGALVDLLPAVGGMRSTAHLLDAWWSFKAFLLVVLLSSIATVRSRRWLPFVYTLLFSSGALVLVLITDRDVGSPFMFENFYPVISCCWCLLFADQVIEGQSVDTPWLSRGTWAATAIGMWTVFQAHHVPTENVRYCQRITDVMRERGVHKAIGTSRVLPWTYIISDWSLPMETAIVSSLTGPRNTVTFFCVDDPAPFMELGKKPDSFLGPSWEPAWFNARYLNKRYFELPDGPYQEVTTRMDGSPAPFDLVLVPPISDIPFAMESPTIVPIQLHNRSEHAIGCLDQRGEPMRLRASILSPKMVIVHTDTIPLPLEQDIPAQGYSVQGLSVMRPPGAGVHRVVVELMRGDSVTGHQCAFWMVAKPFGL